MGGEFLNRNYLFFIVFSFSILVSFCTTSLGQPSESPCGKPWQTPLLEVEGEIKRIYYAVPPGTPKKGLHLKVETKPEEFVIIHVFPKKCVDNSPEKFKFKKGDTVTASGSKFLTKRGTQVNICATKISSHALLDLRNEEDGSINT
ncbi:MAG: hypothetical protein D3923_02660, partial [Candidatus Electrothrix sp. AR3]|nr:hypothetical protein [Candidatus Electrothrix sp. AR3]